MKRMLGLLLVVVCCAAMLASCSGLGSTSQASTVGPDTATTETTTGTTAARLDAGMTWLWASISGLRDKLATLAAVAPQAATVAEQALDKARLAVMDVETAVKVGRIDDALALWAKARSAIGKVAGMAQALAVTRAAGV